MQPFRSAPCKGELVISYVTVISALVISYVSFYLLIRDQLYQLLLVN